MMKPESNIEWIGGERPRLVPDEHRRQLAPALWVLDEWKDYWLLCPNAASLTLRGRAPLTPVYGKVFRLRFENEVGACDLQPRGSDGRHLGSPTHIEVIASKLGGVAEHLSFTRALLEDLFARAVHLPFAITAPTGRGVIESMRPPTPLFTYYFLCQHAAELMTAVSVVQADPHRLLGELSELVPIGQAAVADADTLFGVLTGFEHWVPFNGGALARRLNGHLPARVWQRRPEETFDTSENRFVRAFLRSLLVAADELPGMPWWHHVRDEHPSRERTVVTVKRAVRECLRHPVFAEVGTMTSVPLASRVLQRREGYRDLRRFWESFQNARRPFFEPLRHAMDVRDVATLYELWVFVALVDEIGNAVGPATAVDLKPSVEQGIGFGATASFGASGVLEYNGGQKSWSIALRPDFTWKRNGRAEVVLDAKFRLDRRSWDDKSGDGPQATAKMADLYKMHTYRDALVGVRAAVCVYPGDEAVFFPLGKAGNPHDKFSLWDLLTDTSMEGVGALPMDPRNMVGGTR